MVFLPVLFSALGIVCAGTCFYHVKLKEPLTALKQGISHIADNDLDFSIGYGRQDELGELCRAFETMRGELVKNNRYMWGLVEERKTLPGEEAFRHRADHMQDTCTEAWRRHPAR